METGCADVTSEAVFQRQHVPHQTACNTGARWRRDEIYDLSIEPSGIFNTLDQGSRDLIWLQSVGVVPIFIYYLVRYAPDRASKQRKEAKEQERVLSQRSSVWTATKSSRGGVGGASSRQNRWLPSNDDDINSVDGGPPSEASDDDG